MRPWCVFRSIHFHFPPSRRLGATTLLLAVFLPGCRPREDGHPAASLGATTLLRRLEAEPATLNPILQTSEFEGQVLSNVTRNLIDVDEHLQFVGGLCDHWDISPDLRTYTFHLRNEAVWEDGTRVTAHDAAVTLNRIADSKVPALLFSSGLESYAGTEELDSKTFRVHFGKPYAFRLTAFRVPLLPAARYEHRDILKAAENRAPVANGPYRFASWRTSESITLVRNDRYWGTRAPFDRIVFRILPDQHQAYRALLRGELDESRLSTAQSQIAATDPEFRRRCRLLQFYDLSFFYLGYNEHNPALADKLTRRALTMLIDRQGIIDQLFGGKGRVLSGPWPQDMAAYDKTIAPYPYDAVKAKALLAEAGWTPTGDGLVRNGKRFRFELLFATGSNTSRQVAEIANATFRNVGIDCRPIPIEWAALTKRMDAGDFDAVLASWANDLSPDLYATWHSSQAAPRGMNLLSYRNPTADRFIEAARVEPDEVQRLALFHALHRILHEDEPATWIFQVPERWAISRRLENVAASPVGLFRFWPGANAWSPQ